MADAATVTTTETGTTGQTAATTTTTTAQTTTDAAATGDGKATADAGTTLLTKAGEPPAAAAKAEAATGAPDAYTAFTLPEGVTLDAGRNTEFATLAKELNLSQAGAQKLVDLAMKHSSADAKAQADAVAASRAGWIETAKADKEYGGAEFDKNGAVAVSAIQRFGTPALKALLDESGLGDHPEMIRFAWRVGRAIAEDSHVAGGGDGGAKRSLEQVAYGNTMDNLKR